MAIPLSLPASKYNFFNSNERFVAIPSVDCVRLSSYPGLANGIKLVRFCARLTISAILGFSGTKGSTFGSLGVDFD